MIGRGVMSSKEHRSDIGKKFLTVRVVRHWSRLPRKVLSALSLEIFKARLEGALINLGLIGVPGHSGTIKDAFQPNLFCDSLIM